MRADGCPRPCIDAGTEAPGCPDFKADAAFVRVHFEFNQADVHPDETAKLQRIGRCLKADHALHVTIEGNADERRTEDRNLTLGDKRATAEDCWAMNRRAVVKPLGTP